MKEVQESELIRKTRIVRKVRKFQKNVTSWSLMRKVCSRNRGNMEENIHQALRLAGYCKKFFWCYTNLPIIMLVRELVCCVYDVLFKMLFISAATAATFFFFYCFRRCLHLFSPKDKYFIVFYLKPNK